jgi:thiamine-phosphate pyrophosphorylase
MLSPLLVLTDRRQLPTGRELVDTIARCAEAGLRTVVLRELDLPEDQRAGLAQGLATHVQVIGARTRLPAAEGIHLHATQTVLDAGGMAVHGRSCHSVQEVAQAVDGGADYVTLSPVAASPSKPGHGPPVDALALRVAAGIAQATGAAQVFALGGVDTSNAAAMRAAGAHGVAVMGAVMRADDPAAVVRDLLEQVR